MKVVDLVGERALSEEATSGDWEPAKEGGPRACIARLPALSEQDISELVERGLKASEEAAQAAAQGQHPGAIQDQPMAPACALPSPLPIEKPASARQNPPPLRGPSRPPRPRLPSFITRSQLVTRPNLEADEPETLRTAIRVPAAARRTDGSHREPSAPVIEDDTPEEPTRRIPQPLLGAFPATLIMPPGVVPAAHVMSVTTDEIEEVEPDTILRISHLPSLPELRRKPMPLPPPLPLRPLPKQALLAAVPPCGPPSPDLPRPVDSSCVPTRPLPALMVPLREEIPAVTSTAEIVAPEPSRMMQVLRKQEPSWMAALVLIALSAIVWHHLGREQPHTSTPPAASSPSVAKAEESRGTAIGRLSEPSPGQRPEKVRADVQGSDSVRERMGADDRSRPAPAALDIDPQRTREVMNAAANAAMSCKQDQPGVARVSVIFEPSGRSTMANVHGGIFGGTPVGSCIASHFRGLSVPSFDGPPRTVWMSVVVP